MRLNFSDDDEVGVNAVWLLGQLDSDPLRCGGRDDAEDGEEESMFGRCNDDVMAM